MEYILESDNLDDYLKADEVIDFRELSILKTASEVIGDQQIDVLQAKLAFEWVRDNIPHTNDAKREDITCTASQVLALGTGICYAKAHLLAALLRACGIPAGFCYQVYYEELHVSDSKIALHGLNAIYLASLDRWIRVDPRGNKEGVNAQFSIEQEMLAFPELDFLDSFIYAKPLPQVVESLQKWPTRSQLWPKFTNAQRI